MAIRRKFEKLTGRITEADLEKVGKLDLQYNFDLNKA